MLRLPDRMPTSQALSSVSSSPAFTVKPVSRAQTADISRRCTPVSFSEFDVGHNSLAPLPWLPGIPDRIANNPDWGPYLAARAQLINDLADQVCASSEAATRADEQDRVLPIGLITDLQVWRAAMQVKPAAPRCRLSQPTCGQLGLSNEVFWRGPGSTDSTGASAPTTRASLLNRGKRGVNGR